MEFWKSLSGLVLVECTSAVPEKMFANITADGISLSFVEKTDELTYRFWIRRKDYRRLANILHSQGNGLKLIRRKGIYWPIKALAHRPGLIVTVLLLFFASLYLPSRVLFVAVEGNTTIPDRLILAEAETCGIRFGASRKLVRSEKVKNSLLSALPGLQWAGVNTSGCVATITVRERVPEKEQAEEKIVSNIVADRDAYLLSVTTTSGTAHVRPGETVAKDQLMISGYTDCGLCIRATRAEGEILAQTNREVRAAMPDTYESPISIRDIKRKIGLLIGKKRIILWKDSRISDTGCGRMYEEYFVSLPGGFQLPIGIWTDRYLDYEMQRTAYSEKEARMQLERFSEDCLNGQMIAGQILRKQHRLFHMEGFYNLHSSYVCTEMIGKESREQIGDIHEQRN